MSQAIQATDLPRDVQSLLDRVGDDEILDKKEVASLLGVSERTIEHRMRTAQIPWFKIGRCTRFSRNAVLAKIYSEMNGL